MDAAAHISISMAPVLMYSAWFRIAGTATRPTAEKPVRNFPASIHLQQHQDHLISDGSSNCIGCHIYDTRANGAVVHSDADRADTSGGYDTERSPRDLDSAMLQSCHTMHLAHLAMHAELCASTCVQSQYDLKQAQPGWSFASLAWQTCMLGAKHCQACSSRTASLI